MCDSVVSFKWSSNSYTTETIESATLAGHTLVDQVKRQDKLLSEFRQFITSGTACNMTFCLHCFLLSTNSHRDNAEHPG